MSELTREQIEYWREIGAAPSGLAFRDLCDIALSASRAEKVLPADVVKMCAHRGWSMHWTHRGAYLHLEASELIEAIRGKHGDPMKEAADVLLVLMSITEYAGISWTTVLQQARAKCDELMVKPHYPGEEYSVARDLVQQPEDKT